MPKIREGIEEPVYSKEAHQTDLYDYFAHLDIGGIIEQDREIGIDSYDSG